MKPVGTLPGERCKGQPSKCDNLVWQVCTRKLRCAKLCTQLLHTSTRFTTFVPVPWVHALTIVREPSPRPRAARAANARACAARKLAQIVAAKSSPARRRPRAISPISLNSLDQRWQPLGEGHWDRIVGRYYCRTYYKAVCGGGECFTSARVNHFYE